jgi:hypothetical protein
MKSTKDGHALAKPRHIGDIPLIDRMLVGRSFCEVAVVEVYSWKVVIDLILANSAKEAISRRDVTTSTVHLSVSLRMLVHSV